MYWDDLVHKTIWVSTIQLNKISSAHCMMCSLPQGKSLFLSHFPLSHLCPPLPPLTPMFLENLKFYNWGVGGGISFASLRKNCKLENQVKKALVFIRYVCQVFYHRKCHKLLQDCKQDFYQELRIRNNDNIAPTHLSVRCITAI